VIYIDQVGMAERFGAEELDGLLDGDTDRMARAAQDATSEIDGYLAVIYRLPLRYVPAIVAGWAANIARFRLWDQRAPEEVRRRYEGTIEQLRDLAASKMALPPGAGDDARPSTGRMAAFSAPRVFTTETLGRF
jgi:phage gp36-like protein